MVGITRDLPVGHQFLWITKLMTRERMAVFSDMEHSTCVGYLQMAPPNIHNDLEFAQSEGFPALVADGLITAPIACLWFLPRRVPQRRVSLFPT